MWLLRTRRELSPSLPSQIRMDRRRGRLLRTLAMSLLLALTLGAGSMALSRPAMVFASGNSDGNGDYLALGDSVAFGFSPLLSPTNASNFVGYPSPIATALDEQLTNASCPGQTSDGLISLTGSDNGCFAYRANFPLHVAYNTSQLDYAVQFLTSHPQTRLVTIDIGANDLFLLNNQCKGSTTCVEQGLPGLLAKLSANLDTIYGTLHNAAHFSHQLIALTYYSLNYGDPAQTGIISAVDQVIVNRTLAWGGLVADGFNAFAAASLGANGNPCTAGLLIALPGGGCDIHPSAAGRKVLAQAFLTVIENNQGQQTSASKLASVRRGAFAAA